VTGDVVPEPEPDECEPAGDVRAPDAIEPLIAYRSWLSDPDSRLHSLNDRAMWTPEWMTAQCSSRDHSVPHEGCECGFYATKEGDALALTVVFLGLLAVDSREPRTGVGAVRANHPGFAAIAGSVQLAGKVIEHDDGYRAERARIVEVFPISGWSREARSVAERYGVPLGEEIPIPLIPDFDPTGGGCGSAAMYPSLDEPTVFGRLSILAISLICIFYGIQGILEWSDWWLSLMVLGGVAGTWHAIATFPPRDATVVLLGAWPARRSPGSPARRARPAPSLLRRAAVSGDVVPERPDRDEAEPANDAQVPDGIEPITAYRLWQVAPDGNLRSLFGELTWLPGAWMAAHCDRSGHSAPHEGCTCGLYATRGLDDVLALAGTIETADAVVGRVELSGKVIEHDHGYRAELARVTEILPIEGQRARIGPVIRRYGVPIGEEIPASLFRTVQREGPRSRAPTGHSARTATTTRPSGTPKAAESLPWLLLIFAQITFNTLAAGMHRYDWSDWHLPAAIVGSIIAVGVWIFVRLWMGHRFSRQLRSFVSAPKNRPP
jgi:hypothetical protein